VETGIGIVKKVPDVIPTPEALFQASKNVVAGYPFDVAFRIINVFCRAALSSNEVKPRVEPDINSMNFVLKFNHTDYLIPLSSPELLWQHEKFNPSWPTALLVTGWNTNYNDSLIGNWALDTVYEAYHCRGNINFITVDTAAFVDTLYTWSSYNTDTVGEKIAEALQILIPTYPIEKLHLIGHSLGAHIVGSAGRTLSYKTGKLLPRITGLDPANPCFKEGESLSGLARGDAAFVDIIHTNCGALGKRDSIGDVDFYPNGLHPLPPGCLTIPCAHGRAWEFYAESVYPDNELNFMATKCTSLTALDTDMCPGRKYPMGFAVPHNLKGNFFLSTNRESPYGENHVGGKTFRCNVEH